MSGQGTENSTAGLSPAEKCYLSYEVTSPNEEAALHCPPQWDSLLCWPRTRAATLVVQACFDELHGIKYDTNQEASRWCLEDGSWESYSNYSRCRELKLVSPEAEDGVEITTQLYLVGYSLSFVTLLVAVSIYLYYRELRCLRNVIHTHLMFTYILADLLWILNTVSQISLSANQPLCVLFYSLYHYFQLTNFFWMFVEGLYLHLLVVKTFSGDTLKLNVCLLIGWAVPFVVVLIWATAKTWAGQRLLTDGIQEAALSRHCSWMIPHPLLDWIYEVPAVSVLGANVIFLFMIMWVLITKLRSANNAETQQYRKAAKALLVLIPLLGVTYILVLAGPTEGQAANMFTYARAVLLSSQGFLVALFYCFTNNEVRTALRNHYERWFDARSIGSDAIARSKRHRSRSRSCESTRLQRDKPATGGAEGADPRHEPAAVKGQDYADAKQPVLVVQKLVTDDSRHFINSSSFFTAKNNNGLCLLDKSKNRHI
ncbi:diuretic hormone receptor-like [Trichogramma pretiosum]|uniref:diuretic hormone receptor-like n=1 Tax=Trichogramma pretiosum TaxID=7493 RepID=UPI0006C9A5CB|nr:diuretic hormone receptor-like [Trichogramma pretiosum]